MCLNQRSTAAVGQKAELQMQNVQNQLIVVMGVGWVKATLTQGAKR